MTVDELIARWTAREGGAERANYQMFLSNLCDVLGVARLTRYGRVSAAADGTFSARRAA